MAFSTTPIHGKNGNIFWLRPNGFKGSGLNDLTWGSYSAATASAHFEIAIFSTGAPDTFKIRENGGTWDDNTGVGYAITGSEQTYTGINGTVAFTFAATTGHTVGDQWSVGHLYSEPTTIVDNEAQITSTLRRLLNPNDRPTWTDSGGATLETVDYTTGKATFASNPTSVTVTGDNGYILESGLQELGFIQDWTLNPTIDIVDGSYMGTDWKEFYVGMAGATGSINKMFIANHNLFEALNNAASGTQSFVLLQLFVYDPDRDQTGTHINLWAIINSWGIDAPKADLVKSNINFTSEGIVSTIMANS